MDLSVALGHALQCIQLTNVQHATFFRHSLCSLSSFSLLKVYLQAALQPIFIPVLFSLRVLVLLMEGHWCPIPQNMITDGNPFHFFHDFFYYSGSNWSIWSKRPAWRSVVLFCTCGCEPVFAVWLKVTRQLMVTQLPESKLHVGVCWVTVGFGSRAEHGHVLIGCCCCGWWWWAQQVTTSQAIIC